MKYAIEAIVQSRYDYSFSETTLTRIVDDEKDIEKCINKLVKDVEESGDLYFIEEPYFYSLR